MILEDRKIETDFTRRFAEIDVSYSLAQRVGSARRSSASAARSAS
jgi:hypothetical protein